MCPHSGPPTDEEEAAPVDKIEQVHGVSEEDMPNPNTFSVLWNSMIVPFLRSAIYGVIWYQGESDTIAPTSYECMPIHCHVYWS